MTMPERAGWCPCVTFDVWHRFAASGQHAGTKTAMYVASLWIEQLTVLSTWHSLAPCPASAGRGAWRARGTMLMWAALAQLLHWHRSGPWFLPAGLHGDTHLAIGAGPDLVQRAVRPPQNLYLALLQVAILPRRARHRRAQAAGNAALQAHVAHRLRSAALIAVGRRGGGAPRHRWMPSTHSIPEPLPRGVVPGTVLKWGRMTRVARWQGPWHGCLRLPWAPPLVLRDGTCLGPQQASAWARELSLCVSTVMCGT